MHKQSKVADGKCVANWSSHDDTHNGKTQLRCWPQSSPINNSEAEREKPFHPAHTKKGFIPHPNLQPPVLVTQSPATPVWAHIPPHSHIPGSPEAEGGFLF